MNKIDLDAIVWHYWCKCRIVLDFRKIVERRLVIFIGVSQMSVKIDGRCRILVVLVDQLVEHLLRLFGLPHFEIAVALFEV